MDLETFVSLLVGSVVSIAATWGFAHIYYRRAGKELQVEAEQLRQETGRVRTLVNTLAHALDAGGQIEGVWNTNNELQSFVVRGSAALVAESKLSAEGHETVAPSNATSTP